MGPDPVALGRRGECGRGGDTAARPLDHGADLHATAADGSQPLPAAAVQDASGIALLLLDRGAAPHARRRAEDAAALGDGGRCVRARLGSCWIAEQNVRARDAAGRTPMLRAARSGAKMAAACQRSSKSDQYDQLVIQRARSSSPTRTPGYLGALGIPLRAGRWFDARDDADRPPVVAINETLAQQHWPATGPLGRRVSLSVVSWETDRRGDRRRRGRNPPGRLPQRPAPGGVRVARQVPTGAMSYVVRTAGDPLASVSAIQDVVWGADPLQTFYSIATVEQLLSDPLAARRFITTLLTLFVAAALVLATLGILRSDRGRHGATDPRKSVSAWRWEPNGATWWGWWSAGRWVLPERASRSACWRRLALPGRPTIAKWRRCFTGARRGGFDELSGTHPRSTRSSTIRGPHVSRDFRTSHKTLILRYLGG